MMQLAYAIAFLCLLRLEEVLRLDISMFRILDEELSSIEITLPFRKTHQFGGMLSTIKYITTYN